MMMKKTIPAVVGMLLSTPAMAADIPSVLSQQDAALLTACVSVSGRACTLASIRLGEEWRSGEYYLTCEAVPPAAAGKTYRVKLTNRPMCDVTAVP